MMDRRGAVAAVLVLTLAGCAPAVAPPTDPDVVVVRAPVAVPKGAVPAPAPRATEGSAPAEPVPQSAPEPDPASSAAGVLSIPAAGFSAEHTETITPDSQGVVRPTTRDGLARVTADGLAAELWAVHSGGPSGGGPGGVLTVPDPERFVGAVATLPDGATATVVDAWVSDKSATVERLAAAMADPDAVVLVTCQVERTPRARHNVVLILRRV